MDKTISTEGSPTPPKYWDRCHVYLSRKGRFCNQFPSKNGTHCGNHVHLLRSANSEHCTDERERIPCPIDPSHLIFADQVEKHQLICPKFRNQREQEGRPYFRRNVNLGGHGGMGDTSPRDRTAAWAQNFALKLLEIHQKLYCGKSPKDIRHLTNDDIYDAIPMKDLSQPEIAAGLPEAVEAYRIKSGGHRHLIQQASLIGHLRRIGVLPGLNESSSANDIIFLEMGAGRGMLGLVAAGVASLREADMARLVLVERSGSRSKADTVLRTNAGEGQPGEASQQYMRLRTVEWTRIQCDLAHVHMPTVLNQYTCENDEPLGRKRKGRDYLVRPKVVVIAKHLCGAGTDLALKSLKGIASQVDACIMATCCHGVCTWSEYVGRGYLCEAFIKHNLEFGMHEFELIRRWSTGTVATEGNTLNKEACDDKEYAKTAFFDKTSELHSDKMNDFPNDNFTLSTIIQQAGLSCDVHGVGRACQRLLDYGRCKFLEHELKFAGSPSPNHVELCHYVPSMVTPQNAVLVCCKPLTEKGP